ncbi:dynein regulatory complex subunit 5 [Antennarius striatus]|uniref:dynein regulatory complex subunit 5 n=1 Tax=Antennarius striatus TaxID=241820 RepID=UPI0035B27B4B
MRRTIAEDPDWSLVTVPNLSVFCLHSIVRNFEEHPSYEDLPPNQKDFVEERLSPSLPLHVTANTIHDGVYWERCCKRRWELCVVSLYGHSWKRMFFERHLENVIELFIPDVTGQCIVLELVPLCKNYVKRLNISQLLPPIRELQGEEEESCSALGSDDERDGPSMDHFDFSILLHLLTNLEELHLSYAVQQCGMNFQWNMVEMTNRDCESLGKALKSCKTLKLLKLQQSHVDDKKCRMLVKYLLDHPSLRELDFSYNLIGDEGARALGKLLTQSKLETLNMSSNQIRGPGAKAIAHALSGNPALLSLNLRLNLLGDEGGEAIAKALMSNNTLQHLHLPANRMTRPTAVALSEALLQNKSLKTLNLCCNQLGVDGGKALEEAMSSNSTLTSCDIYQTEVDEQSFSFINRVVRTNQEEERRADELKTDELIN